MTFSKKVINFEMFPKDMEEIMIEDKVKTAKSEGQIVIYTTLKDVLLNLISGYRDAHKQDHTHISFYSAHPMAVYNKIKEEIKAGIPTADMVILPHYLVLQMQREGFFRSYTSIETKSYPKEFYSKDGWATMLVEPIGPVYNPFNLNKDDIPTTVEELADPKWKGKIAMQALTKHSEGMLGLYYIMALKQYLGEKRWRSFLSNLVKNVNPAVFECLLYMSQSVGNGDYQIGIPITIRKASMIDAVEGMKEGRVEYLPLEDVPQMASFKTMGLMKNSSNPKTANQYYDFALSKGFQELLGQRKCGELPSRPGVKTTFWVTTPNIQGTHYFPKMEDVANFQRSVSEIKTLGLI